MEDVAWRRKLGNAAGWVLVFLVANIAARGTYAAQSWPRLAALALEVLWFTTYIGLAGATWSLTAPHPGSRVHWLGWTLRFVVLLPLAAIPALARVVSVPDLDAANMALGALQSLAGLAYVAHLFAAAGQRRRSREALGLGVLSFVFGSGFAVSHSAQWASFSALWLIWGFALLRRLRRMLLVDQHYWWFDNGSKSPGEWVALLVHKDKHAEVLCVDETLGWFDSEDEAAKWLEDNSYVPAERAVRERLVGEAPPDVLKARIPKRVPAGRAAAASPEPRMRVASDASDGTADKAANDDLAESADLDEREPSRSIAVHGQHDPRT